MKSTFLFRLLPVLALPALFVPHVTQLTTRASLDSMEMEGNAPSSHADISTGGNRVAYESVADNLVVGDTNQVADVFFHDRQSHLTVRVSVDSAGAQGNGASGEPAVSDDARFVAFASAASNLVAGDGNGSRDVFVHDRQTGATTLASVPAAGGFANGDSFSPALSADGRFVAFLSAASDLVPGDTNGRTDVFVNDRQTGLTTRVSLSTARAEANADCAFAPAIRADGRFVAFTSSATNLVAGDSNGVDDVFVHDRATGRTRRVSVSSTRAQGNAASGRRPSLADHGMTVAFTSAATNLVPGDGNGVEDVFVHDLQTGQTSRVSQPAAGGGWQRSEHGSQPLCRRPFGGVRLERQQSHCQRRQQPV
jgi:Tol biopolymer transport system component